MMELESDREDELMLSEFESEDDSTSKSMDDSIVHQTILFHDENLHDIKSHKNSESIWHCNALERRQFRIRVSVQKLVLNTAICEVISRILIDMIGRDGRAFINFSLQYQPTPYERCRKDSQLHFHDICQIHILPTLHLTANKVNKATVEKYTRMLKYRLPRSQKIVYSTEQSLSEIHFNSDVFIIQLVMKIHPSTVCTRNTRLATDPNCGSIVSGFPDKRDIVIAYARLRGADIGVGTQDTVSSELELQIAPGALTINSNFGIKANIGSIAIGLITFPTDAKHKATESGLALERNDGRESSLPTLTWNKGNKPLELSISSDLERNGTVWLIIYVSKITGVHSSSNSWTVRVYYPLESILNLGKSGRVVRPTEPRHECTIDLSSVVQNQIVIPFTDAMFSETHPDDESCAKQCWFALEFSSSKSLTPLSDTMSVIIPIIFIITPHDASKKGLHIKTVDLILSSSAPIPVRASVSLAAGAISQVRVYPGLLRSATKIQRAWRSWIETRLQIVLNGRKIVTTCRNASKNTSSGCQEKSQISKLSQCGTNDISKCEGPAASKVVCHNFGKQNEGKINGSTGQDPELEETNSSRTNGAINDKYREQIPMTTSTHSFMSKYSLKKDINRLKSHLSNIEKPPATNKYLTTERTQSSSGAYTPFHIRLRVGAMQGLREQLTLWIEHQSLQCKSFGINNDFMSNLPPWLVSATLILTFQIFSGVNELGWHTFSSRITCLDNFVRNPNFDYQTDANCVLSDQFHTYLRLQSVHFTLWIDPSKHDEFDFEGHIERENEIPKTAIKLCQTHCPLYHLLESSNYEYSQKCQWALTLSESDDAEVIGNVFITISRVHPLELIIPGTSPALNVDLEPSMTCDADVSAEDQIVDQSRTVESIDVMADPINKTRQNQKQIETFSSRFYKTTDDLCFKTDEDEKCTNIKLDDTLDVQDNIIVEDMHETTCNRATRDVLKEKELWRDEGVINSVLVSLDKVNENLQFFQRNANGLSANVECLTITKEPTDIKPSALVENTNNNYLESNPFAEKSLSCVAQRSIKSLDQVCQDLKRWNCTSKLYSTGSANVHKDGNNLMSASLPSQLDHGRKFHKEETNYCVYNLHRLRSGFDSQKVISSDNDSDSASSHDTSQFTKPWTGITQAHWGCSSLKSHTLFHHLKANAAKDSFKVDPLASIEQLSNARWRSTRLRSRELLAIRHHPRWSLSSTSPSPCSTPSSCSSASKLETRSTMRRVETDSVGDIFKMRIDKRVGVNARPSSAPEMRANY